MRPMSPAAVCTVAAMGIAAITSRQRSQSSCRTSRANQGCIIHGPRSLNAPSAMRIRSSSICSWLPRTLSVMRPSSSQVRASALRGPRSMRSPRAKRRSLPGANSMRSSSASSVSNSPWVSPTTKSRPAFSFASIRAVRRLIRGDGGPVPLGEPPIARAADRLPCSPHGAPPCRSPCPPPRYRA